MRSRPEKNKPVLENFNVEKRPQKQRLDAAVFEKGLTETRAKAQALILGGNVYVNGAVCYKSGEPVKSEDIIEVKNVNPYVSRGGLKLESALCALNIDVGGFICLDIGASTGGFTDCLLQKAALKVYAVDVGTKQLHYKLRKDPRVVSYENVNFRYFELSALKDPIDFATIDVSFISLDKILPAAYKSVKNGGFVLAMIKPQFELEAREIKKGVVRDEKLRLKAIDKIKNFALTLGFKIISEADSALKGPKGNLEHFVLLQK
ncbi:MAG: TlyA family RNA methyltransferase [Endomicrobium sp.]|jgi:23S rRNA (cytidine1920-2'-O)/16S rRNA (cytidine1409-2'-O)-methyltransferase|nr:TlyA family RNA methyltransferase [Endomicrobium sp.]